jgi:hypothetical protein
MVKDRKVGLAQDFFGVFTEAKLGLMCDQPVFRPPPPLIDLVPIEGNGEGPRLKIHCAGRLNRNFDEASDRGLFHHIFGVLTYSTALLYYVDQLHKGSNAGWGPLVCRKNRR